MVSASQAPGSPTARVNRQRDVLDAAARLFREHGFEGASMRDIAAASGMLPGSLYFHFPSKDEIYLAVQAEGIRHVSEAVRDAVSGIENPWDRLRAACRAHLNVVLDESDYAAVLISARPAGDAPIWRQVRDMRDRYEDLFRALVDDLPLPRGSNRKYLRLALLGAMNWSPTWYRSGRDQPAEIADQVLALFRRAMDEGDRP